MNTQPYIFNERPAGAIVNSQSRVLNETTHFAEHPQDFLSFRLCVMNVT